MLKSRDIRTNPLGTLENISEGNYIPETGA
jgi:hypothetical protein